MKKSRAFLALVVGVAGLVAIGCGSDGYGPSEAPVACEVDPTGLATVASGPAEAKAEACVDGNLVELEYCGGGPNQSDVKSQISCTAFPAKPKNPSRPSYCTAPEVFNLAGPDGTAGVWKATGYNDYWIIHGCDGAGLMNDDRGANFYVEHYLSPATAPTKPTDCSSFNPADCRGPDWNQEACGCVHQRTAFVHPGTSKAYQYDAGMWTFAPGTWPDKEAGKKWWSNMDLPPIADLQGDYQNQAATAFVVMYPWVCNGPWDTQNYAPYWGSDGNYANGLPFGDITYQTNCYYDNEPWDGIIKGRHDTSTLEPPVWEAYKFVKKNENDNFITGYKIGYKKMGDREPTYIADAPAFTLNWLPDGPPP